MEKQEFCAGQGLVKEIGHGKTRKNAEKSGSNPRSSALIRVLYNSKQCLTITEKTSFS